MLRVVITGMRMNERMIKAQFYLAINRVKQIKDAAHYRFRQARPRAAGACISDTTAMHGAASCAPWLPTSTGFR